MAFHEKAGRSQVGFFVFSLDIVFLTRREEASDRRHRKKAGGAAASSLGEWRRVRTVAQQQPNHSGGGRVERKTKQKSKSFQEVRTWRQEREESVAGSFRRHAA